VRDWHPERSGSRSGRFRCERNGATVFPVSRGQGPEALSEAERERRISAWQILVVGTSRRERNSWLGFILKI
jgi:hypothetical protein